VEKSRADMPRRNARRPNTNNAAGAKAPCNGIPGAGGSPQSGLDARGSGDAEARSKAQTQVKAPKAALRKIAKPAQAGLQAEGADAGGEIMRRVLEPAGEGR